MDLLSKLKENGPKNNSNEEKKEERRIELKDNSKKSVNPTEKKEQRPQEDRNQFLSDSDNIEENTAIIKNATQRISEISQLVLLSVTDEQESPLSKEFATIINKTNKIAAETKSRLQAMQRRTKAMILSQMPEVTADVRLRENLCNNLSTKFIEAIREYQDTQSGFKNALKRKVTRQMRTLKPGAMTEEIDAVYKAGGGTRTLYKQAILKGDAAQAIQDAFLKAEDQIKDVLVLEASVAELHQMFIDFSLLVEHSGEKLDQIEKHIDIVDEEIDDGKKKLKESISILKEIQNRKSCIALIVLIIVGIIVGLIVAKAEGGF